MTQVELVKNINLGIVNSVKNYYNLSGGDFIGYMAGENFIVSSIVSRLIKLVNRDGNKYYLKVEYPFSKMMENDYHVVGRPPELLRGLGRIDIAFVNRLYQLKYAIEVKIGRQLIDNDIIRLRTLYNKFNCVSMKCGISALLIFFKSDNKINSLKGLNCNLKGWVDYYNNIDSGKGNLEFKKNEDNIFVKTKDKIIAATSLCAVIK